MYIKLLLLIYQFHGENNIHCLYICRTLLNARHLKNIYLNIIQTPCCSYSMQLTRQAPFVKPQIAKRTFINLMSKQSMQNYLSNDIYILFLFILTKNEKGTRKTTAILTNNPEINCSLSHQRCYIYEIKRNNFIGASDFAFLLYTVLKS